MRSPHACYGPSNHGVQSTGDASFGGTRRASAGSFRSISAVRRDRRSRRPLLHDRPRPNLRADRAERRREDDAVQRRQPHLRPHVGRSAVRGRGPAERPRLRHRRSRGRAHVPEPRAVPDDDDPRQRHGRCHLAFQDQLGHRRVSHRRREGRPAAAPRSDGDPDRARARAVRPPSRHRPALRHVEANRDRAGDGGATRACCSSTSPPAASPTARSRSSRRPSATCATSTSSRSCSSSTTCRW